MNAESVISDEEAQEAEKRQRPRSVVIFETIRREGANELDRPSASLFWSAFAAGLSMVFSLITQGILRAGLPDAPWRTLVAAFGYTLGFLIVILGRQQLFTENTLTPLLPVFNDPKAWRVRALVRLWTVIFCANLLGAAIAAGAVALGGAFSPEQLRAFDELAKETVAPPFAIIFTKAIFAGWILALMVWLLPLADQLSPVIIILLTYIIAAGQLSHSIAGSVDALYGVWSGVTTLGDYAHFIVPTFFGNIVGGVAFVAAISSAEIAAERGRTHRQKVAPR